MARDRDATKTPLSDDQWTTVVTALDSGSKTERRGVANRKFAGLRLHNRDSASITFSARVNDGTTQTVFIDAAVFPTKHTLLLTEADDGFELDNDEYIEVKLAASPATTAPIVIARKIDF